MHAATPGPPPAWADGLHEEVRRLATQARSRRHLPAQAWVGVPGGEPDLDVLLLPPVPAALPDGAAAGLRTDLVERALAGLEDLDGALCWMTRSGELGVGDDELAWWSAARRAFSRHGVALPGFCVLNRFGWLDLASGSGRTWTRVRPHPG